LRWKISQAGRALVAQRYTVDRSVEQWSEQLSAVLGLPRQPASTRRNVPPDGRLDRIFGARLGEAIRRFIGREFHHVEPGGEWPHAYGAGAMDAETFWRISRTLDCAQDDLRQ
jgi:hypothetical protein